ncbi:hypothetical protein DY000_02043491, partial [Brassica cretica]
GTKASCALESELKRVDSRLDTLEGSIEEVKSRPFVSREELERVYEELKKVKVRDSLVSDVGIVDELRAYARGIVEKEIGKNGADGLGIVDYALGSGGGGSGGYVQVSLRGPIVPEAVTLEHVSKDTRCVSSFELCIPLCSCAIYFLSTILMLRFMHREIEQAVAYDRSSAPKDCRVSGWLEEKDMESETMLLL